MSKHCPSRPKVRGRHAAPEPTERAWQRRVFRNSFTRLGKTYRLKGWSFKVQMHGRRRTFSLAGTTRVEAAQEAEQIHKAVLGEGWEAALELHRALRRSAAFSLAAIGQASLGKSALVYWEQRLIQRPYREARLVAGKEYSVRFDHDGTHAYFPLGTDEAKSAVLKARAIHQTLLAKGWETVFERFEREITLAISWADNPLAVTYTTLFSFLREPPAQAQPLAAGNRSLKPLIVLEPDPTTHACLRYWLDRQPGFYCRHIYRTPVEMMAAMEEARTAIVLINQITPDTTKVAERLKSLWPDLPVFPYRIHEDSDQIFISVSGVSGGYIFRRRLPTGLFDPLQPVARARTMTASEAGRCIRNYFQGFFGDPGQPFAPAVALEALTHREQEILNQISRGCPDKKIADLLNISIWTVHNHLKNIYDKLGVHNRTEAVLRCLQR